MRILNGVDLVSSERFAKLYGKHGQALLNKLLTDEEIVYCKDSVEKMAARFAAKEAVLKALGTGFWQNGVRLKDVSVLPDELGAPQVQLAGRAARRYEELAASSLSLSISHEAGLVIAFCTILVQ